MYRCAVVHCFIVLSLYTCHAAELRLYLGSVDNYTTTPLDKPTAILPYLDPAITTLFYTYGFDTNSSSESVLTVVTAYINTRQYNVVLLDWYKGAQPILGIKPVSYFLYNAPETKDIGCKFGQALAELMSKGLNPSKVVCMGHSLGAQLTGYAGRCAKEKGLSLYCIIGLDPAGPGYNYDIISTMPTLDSTCAKNVVILHTDPGGKGEKAATGHYDFYPNYKKESTTQPGCAEDSNTSSCNHSYAWRLISASAGAYHLLPAMSAANGTAWLAGLGNPHNIAYISVQITPGNLQQNLQIVSQI